MQNINSVVVSGNLTRDPELRATPSGTSVCSLRVACNGSRKNSSDEWVDDPNFFDVTVWGRSGENCSKYLEKGRKVTVQGRLDWREWETDQGGKRQAVQIVADRVEFGSNARDGDRDRSERDRGDLSEFEDARPQSGGRSADDDIPF